VAVLRLLGNEAGLVAGGVWGVGLAPFPSLRFRHTLAIGYCYGIGRCSRRPLWPPVAQEASHHRRHQTMFLLFYHPVGHLRRGVGPHRRLAVSMVWYRSHLVDTVCRRRTGTIARRLWTGREVAGARRPLRRAEGGHRNRVAIVAERVGDLGGGQPGQREQGTECF
jgi:hypothetical protein